MTNAITRDEDHLTPKMRRFVDALLANGGNRTDAAKQAGYGEKSAHVTGCRLSKLPKIRRALAGYTDLILADAAPQAAQTLSRLLNHKSGYVQLEASKDILNRTGHAPKGDAGNQQALVVNIRLGNSDPNVIDVPGVTEGR